MWLMLQQNDPDDYVIATGKTTSVQKFVAESFSCVGLDWREFVEIDPKYYRPAEVDCLLGDPSKAKVRLGWEAKTQFKDLVRLMMDADLEMAQREAHGNAYERANFQPVRALA